MRYKKVKQFIEQASLGSSSSLVNLSKSQHKKKQNGKKPTCPRSQPSYIIKSSLGKEKKMKGRDIL